MCCPQWRGSKQNADRLGFDPTRLVLLGRSAGAQIATAVGYGANDPAIRGIVALYGPHDMPFAWSVSREDDALNSIKLLRQLFGGPPEGKRRMLYESASGQLLGTHGFAPALVIHGANDTLSWCRHSERLAARLQELNAPHYYLVSRRGRRTGLISIAMVPAVSWLITLIDQFSAKRGAVRQCALITSSVWSGFMPRYKPTGATGLSNRGIKPLLQFGKVSGRRQSLLVLIFSSQ